MAIYIFGQVVSSTTLKLASWHQYCWLQVVYKECVPLFFTVFTNSYEPCCAFFNAIGSGSTTYHFKIGFNLDLRITIVHVSVTSI